MIDCIVEDSGARLAARRLGCCLAYRVPDGTRCEDCPLVAGRAPR
jgi:ferric iron reductase protein FhuF